MNKEQTLVKVSGKAYWTFINKPDTRWDRHAWCTTLRMNAEEAKKLRNYGVKIKHALDENKDEMYDDNGKPVYEYKFRRYVNRRDKSGMKNRKPVCVDPAKIPFNGIVGNGSTVDVIGKIYSGSYKGRPYSGVDFVGMQVLELVPYENKTEEGTLPEKLDLFTIQGESFARGQEGAIFDDDEIKEIDEHEEEEEPPF